MSHGDASEPLARARALAGDLDAAGDAIERTRRIPRQLLDRIHDARLCRMLLPRSVDGDEVAPADYFLAVEEVARHDASVAWNLFVANSAALIAPYLEPDTMQAMFADRDALVAWGPPGKPVAKVVPGGYRVSGRWDFASGCRQATWMGVHCRISEPDGSLRQDAHGRPEIRTLLFPVDRATLIDTWNTIGLCGTASDAYKVDDLFVADAFTGLREAPETRREPGPLFAFTMYGLYAVGVAATATGIADAMLRAFVKLGRDKAPRGLTRLADRPATQAGTAEMRAKLAAARAYVLTTLATIYAAAGPDAPIAVDQRAQVRLSATFAIHSAIAVADWVYKAAGVDAIFPGSPYERRFRDMHTLSQQIQARDAHYETVGQVLMGNPPAVFL
jgi:alkylation response protein AidB-like acyl-CoA dehydrogenase